MKHVKSNDIYECVRGLAADGGSAAILEIIERLNAYLAIENGFLVEKVLHLILTSEEQLRYVVREFLEYYNHERCHSGLDGRRIDPRPEPPEGEIRMFPRLGGLLKCYRRVLPGTPGGMPVDAPPPSARASA